MPKTVFLSACSSTGGSLTERADAGKKRRGFCDEKENTGSGRDRRDGLLSCSRASVHGLCRGRCDAGSRRFRSSRDLRYILTDASKDENLFPLLQNEYAGIVDFLIYSDPAKTFLPRRDKLSESTGHYLFLSSYRVYADRDAVTTEESPRRHLFQAPFSAGDAGSPDVYSPHMGKENRSFAERRAFGSAARRRAAFPEKRDL